MDVKVYEDMEGVYRTNLDAIRHDLERMQQLVTTFPENRLYRLLHREILHEKVVSERQLSVLKFLQDTTLKRTWVSVQRRDNARGPRSHAILCSERGLVYAWGSGKYGQLGLGDEINWTRFPHLVRLPSKVAIRQISAGFHHVLALAENGDVWAWGRGEYGQLGLGRATQADKDRVVARKVCCPLAAVFARCGGSCDLSVVASSCGLHGVRS